MVSCININSKEFQEFAKGYDNPLIAELDYMEQLESAERTTEFLNSMVNEKNKESAMSAAEKFTNQLGVPYEIITPEVASKLLGSKGVQPGFFRKGKVYLVQGLFNKDTVFHEFAHPVIMAIANENPELFEKLYSSLTKAVGGMALVEKVTANEPELLERPDLLKQEVLVRALEQIKDEETNTSFLKQILFEIKQFLRKLFGKKINISKLTSNTTLKELSEMIKSGEQFDMNTDSFAEEDVILFQKQYDDTVKWIKDNALKEADLLIENTVDIINSAITDLQKEHLVFTEIKDDLSDEYRTGPLQLLHLTLKDLRIDQITSQLQSEKINIRNYTPQTFDDYLLEVEKYNHKLQLFASHFGQFKATVTPLQKRVQELKNKTSYTQEDMRLFMSLMNYFERWSKITDKMNTSAFSREGSPVKQEIALLSQDTQTALKDLQNIALDMVADTLYEHLSKEYEKVHEQYTAELDSLDPNSKTYEKLHKEIYNLTPAESNELESLRSLGNSRSNENDQRMLLLEMQESYSKFFTKDTLKNSIMYGTNTSKFFETYVGNGLQNSDFTVQGLVSYIEKQLNQVNANANTLETQHVIKIKNAIKNSSLKNLGMDEIGERFSQVETKLDTSGQEVEVKQMMSNFTGWEIELGKLKASVKQAEAQHIKENTQRSKDALRDAKIELEKFVIKNMHQEGVPSVYEYDYLLYEVDNSDPKNPKQIGKMALDKRNEIFEKINIITSFNEVDNSDPEITKAENDLWFEYQQLHSIKNLDGTDKTGDDLAIAKQLISHRDRTQVFYSWDEKGDAFDDAYTQFEDQLSGELAQGNISKDDYDSFIAQWIETNTTIAVKEDYYKEREKLMKERKTLFAPVVAYNNSIKDVTSLYDEITQITKQTKDASNGYYDGTLLDDAGQLHIKKILEEIRDAKLDFITKSGLTPNEFDQFMALRDFREAHGGFPDEFTEQKYNSLLAQLNHRLSAFGITVDDMNRINDIDKELGSMSMSQSTPFYLKTVEYYCTQNPQLKAKVEEIFRIKTGHVIDLDIHEVTDSMWNKILQDEHEVKQILSIDNSFKQWFDRNHYTDSVWVYDGVNNGMVEHYGYKKTTVWSYSIPSDPKWFDQRHVKLSNGSTGQLIQLNGIPRVPNMRYRQRVLKDEYKTEIVERDYVDANGNLVLANVTNQGSQGNGHTFLPREDAEDRFINPLYKNLFENNKPEFEVLQAFKDYTLDVQKNLDNSQKLYLDFPRVRREGMEDMSTKLYKRVVEDVAGTFVKRGDDAQYGEFFANTEKDSGNDYYTRPVSGMYMIDKDFVSPNILRTIGVYNYSVQKYKSMHEAVPFATMLRDVVDNSDVEQGKIKRYKKIVNAFHDVTGDNNNRRVEAITHTIERHLEGRRIASTDKMNYKGIHGVINTSGKIGRIGMFAFNMVSAMKNFLAGELTVLNRMHKFCSASEYAYAQYDSFRIARTFEKDQYSGKKAASTQLAFIFNAGPNVLQKKAGTSGARKYSAGKKWVDKIARAPYYVRTGTNVKLEMLCMTIAMRSLGISVDDYELNSDGLVISKPHVHEDYSISYDADGDAVLGKKINDVIRKNQQVLKETMGITNEVYSGNAERYTVAKLLLFVQKFLPNIIDANYGGIFSKKRRVNLMTGKAERGDMATVLHYIANVNTKKFTRQERDAFITLVKYLLLMILMNSIKGMFTFNTDDDNSKKIDKQGKFKYDEDRENIIPLIKTRTTGVPDPLDMFQDKYRNPTFELTDYGKLHVINLIDQTQREVEFALPHNATKGVFDFTTNTGAGITTLKNQVMFVVDFGKAVVGSEDAVYEKTTGVLRWQEGGDYKFVNEGLKMIGINGKVIMPAYAIESAKKFD